MPHVEDLSSPWAPCTKPWSRGQIARTGGIHHRGAMAMRARFAPLWLAVGLSCAWAGSAWALTCPKAPEAISSDVKAETEAQLAAIGKFKGLALRNKTEVVARNLLEKMPQADRIYAVQLMSSMFCSMLADAKTLTDKERFAEFAAFQKRMALLLVPPRPAGEKHGLAPAPSAPLPLPKPAAPPPPPTHLTAIAKAEWPASAAQLQGDRVLPASATDGLDHALVLHVHARFADQADADDEALRLSHAQLAVWGQAADLLPGASVTLRSRAASDRQAAPLSGVAVLRFRGQPSAATLIQGRMGGFTLTLPLGKMQWSEWVGKAGGAATEVASAPDAAAGLRLAQARLDILIDKVNLAYVRSARFLTPAPGEPALLEVVVDNRADQALFIQNLYLSASHPVASRISCFKGDPVQRLSLNWRAMFREQDANQNWTEIGEDKVAVPTRFNGQGVCSHGYSLGALVPLSRTVQGHQVVGITIRLQETPREMSRSEGRVADADGLLGGGPPWSLDRWADVHVAVNATQGTQKVYPDETPVVSTGDDLSKLRRVH